MRLIGNIIWIILGGLISAIHCALIGLILCITIIGIPFGLQCFKLAGLTLTPFGQKVNINVFRHPIANIIWLVLSGFAVALEHLFFGVILCVTIIGIPFGLQHFKLALLSLFPFGAECR